MGCTATRRARFGLGLGLLFGIALAAPASADLSIRWLGVAGFTVDEGEHTLAFDPYLSRPGFWTSLFSWYRPDESVLAPLLGEGSPAPGLAGVSLILIGHSHFDHLGDAPWIAARTGATVAGSATTVSITQGYEPEVASLLLVPGQVHRSGPFEIETVESRHAKVILGRVPLPGEVLEPPNAPIHALSFPLGDARGYLVTHEPSGRRIFFLSSAGVHGPALDALRARGITADVVLAAMQGREPDFAATLVEALRPRVVVPHHFDDFWAPLEAPESTAPSDPEDLAAFEAEVCAAARANGLDVAVVRPRLYEAVSLDALVSGAGSSTGGACRSATTSP